MSRVASGRRHGVDRDTHASQTVAAPVHETTIAVPGLRSARPPGARGILVLRRNEPIYSWVEIK